MCKVRDPTILWVQSKCFLFSCIVCTFFIFVCTVSSHHFEKLYSMTNQDWGGFIFSRLARKFSYNKFKAIFKQRGSHHWVPLFLYQNYNYVIYVWHPCIWHGLIQLWFKDFMKVTEKLQFTDPTFRNFYLVPFLRSDLNLCICYIYIYIYI